MTVKINCPGCIRKQYKIDPEKFHPFVVNPFDNTPMFGYMRKIVQF